MTKEEILSKLPITLPVTKEIIEASDRWNSLGCIGANTLSQGFPGEFITWGTIGGSIILNDKEDTCIKVESSVNMLPINMMDIESPTDVTFTLLSVAPL